MSFYEFLKAFRDSKIGKLCSKRGFTVTAAVVVFITTYMLILPAITVSSKTYCGQEEHVHSDSCYKIEKNLICGQKETEGHSHSEKCYEEIETLTCSREESSGHHHTDACYEENTRLTCGQEEGEDHTHSSECYTVDRTLVCGQAESEGHTHTSDCYTRERLLVCGKEECKGHEHSSSCYSEEKTLICTDTEHEHTSACYSNPEADKESKEKWEQTIKDVKLTSVWADDVLAIAESQLGYEESTSNYILDEAGKKKGYSRYGDWYGNAYGDWCAMFVSFCIHYADIPTSESTAVTDENGRKIYMPISAGCQNWIELMNRSETPYYYAVDDKNSYNLINDSSDFEPEAGNLIFFNWDSEPDADHVGLVIEVERNKKDEITQIKTIEGNSSNKVKYNTYSPDNKNIMGYAVIPVNPNEIRPEEIAEAESESETESEQNEDLAEPELSGADAEVAEDSEIAAEAETITESEDAENAETRVEAEKAADAETTAKAEEAENAETSAESENAENAETKVEAEEAENAETSAEAEEAEDAETRVEAEEEIENESTADAEPEEGAETTEEAVEPETEETVEEERITRIYDGADFHITLTYEATAGIPAAAEVEVRELMGEEYNKACQEAMEAMGITEISFARFFDITFVVNGEEIEPTGSVEVQIAYDEVIELNEDEIAKAVHFAEDGTEVLDMQEEHTEEGTVLIFEQESFSTTGTVYGISTLAEDDGVSLQAATSDPPAIGSSITAINVQSPEVGKWYIIYGVCPSDSSAGYAMIANNCTYQTMLGQFSTDYGTVTYTGSDDVAWEYTENGFRNRSGQYLVLRYTSGTSSDMSLESSSYSGGVHYSYDYKTLYEKESVWINYRTRVRYNEVYMHTWLTNGQYRNTGEAYTSLAYVAQEEANKRNVFIAEIQESQTGGTRHPRGSVTGTPGAADLVLYNIDGSDETTRTLAGVEYTIYDQEGNIVQSLKTTENFVLKLQPLADGTYTVKQTGVPDGYIVYAQEKTFTVKDGFGFIGIFYDYKDDSIPKVNDKTAEVVDYENRTYRIEIGAQSVEYSYDMEAINYELVVDQSNSMLFPSELTAVKYNGSDVTVTLKNTTSSGENGKALNQLVAQGKIDINKVYYVIANEETTSTVYAIWHDGNGWCYQDAAYYSKAQMHENGIEHNAKEGNGYVHYAEAGKGYSITYSDNTIAYGGGGLDYYGKDSSGNYYSVGGNLGNDVGSSGRSLILYEGSYYNRLHDLQEAVMVFGGQVGSLNENSSMHLITFDKEVESCLTISKLDTNGLATLYDAVDNITTAGGTRQDQALNHVRGEYGGANTANHTKDHLVAGKENIIILITDGAPVGTTVENVESAGDNLKNNSKVTALVTVGLSMTNVKGGSQMLYNIASYDPADSSLKMCFAATKAGELADIMLRDILLKYGTKRKQTGTGDIRDVISDSFYPINPATNQPLTNGTRIALDGSVDSNGPGTVYYDSEKKEWYVVWENQSIGEGLYTTDGTEYLYYANTNKSGTPTVLDTSQTYHINWQYNGNYLPIVNSSTNDDLVFSDGRWIFKWGHSNSNTADAINRGNVVARTTSTTTGTAGWKGHVYLKAKEDFIGGNTIDTNKEASITMYTADGKTNGSIELSNPTVNVRLLPMEGFESEETVFLGDTVSDIKTKIQTLLDMTLVKKIDPYYGSGNILNYKVGASEENGCYDENFTISYALSNHGSSTDSKWSLTDEQWTKLFNGEAVRIDYTYDDASSHGAVGYFTFSLRKEVKGDESLSYSDHDTTVTGEDVEKYTLTVTYTAYGIGETDASGAKRETDVHNGSNGPGTEVGKGSTIPTGSGTESVNEIHHVHVIDGEIFLTKVIDQTLVSDQDQIFSFDLYDSDTGDVKKTVTVTIKAGSTEGTIEINHLPRSRYIVKETDSEDYMVKQVEVVTGDTSCVYETTDPSLIFDIGTNTQSNGVNPDHNVIIYNENSPTYEQSMWVEGERYVYSKPFSKAAAGNSSDNTSGSGSAGESGQGSDSGSTGESGQGTDSGSGSGSSGTHTEIVETTEYEWEAGTIISTDTSGSQYIKLDESQTSLDTAHSNYGILKKDSNNNWVIEWHTWTSKVEDVTTEGSTEYQAVTIGYYQNSPPNLSQYANGDYYYYDTETSTYQKITAIRSDGYNLIITTDKVSNKYVGVKATWLNEKNYITYDVYKLVTTSGTTTQTTTWSEATSTDPAIASKIPTRVTRTEVEVPDSSDNTEDQTSDSGSSENNPSDSGSTTISTKLSFGHGIITNTKAKYTAEVPVRKIWSDGEEHQKDEVYVVLCDSNGLPVTDETGAKMLKLTASNNWQGSFTVAAPTKNYNAMEDGYQIREVKDIRTNEFTDSFTAKLVNVENDESVYYVKVAQDGETITINNKGYEVKYSDKDNTLIVTNYTAYELPETGGIGTTTYTMGGILLMLISLVLYGFNLRRSRERRSL